MTLSGVDKGISIYKTFISEFDMGDLTSGQFCVLTIKAMGKCSNAIFPKVLEVKCYLSHNVII